MTKEQEEAQQKIRDWEIATTSKMDIGSGASTYLKQSYTVVAEDKGSHTAEQILEGIFNAPKASKNDTEKADLSLIPRIALEEAARAFMVGEKKYDRYNFYKGHKASQLIAALLRHATAWMEGEEKDPTDGQHHLGSVIACAAMLLQQQKLGTLKDNRYKKDE